MTERDTRRCRAGNRPLGLQSNPRWRVCARLLLKPVTTGSSLAVTGSHPFLKAVPLLSREPRRACICNHQCPLTFCLQKFTIKICILLIPEHAQTSTKGLLFTFEVALCSFFCFSLSYHVHDLLHRCGLITWDHYNLSTTKRLKQKIY